MEIREAIGFAAAFTTAIGFAPKVISVWKKRSAKDISWWLLSVFAADVALWFAYGYMIWSLPTMVASALVGAFVFELALIKAKYG